MSQRVHTLLLSAVRRGLLLAVLLALLPLPLPAQESDWLPTPITLGRPEVTKLSWNARALIAHDIDGDGRTDLAALNNDRARVELLYQRTPGDRSDLQRPAGNDRWEPLLEDARFRKESCSTGIRMFDLAVGDLDNDGRIDLVYTGSPDALTIRYQRSRGDFTNKRVLDIGEPVGWVASIQIADLNNDGRDDLAVITEGDLLVFTQSKQGELQGPRRYPLSGEDCFGLRAIDADHDGRLDLLYQVANRADALRVRFAETGGGFGPELAFRVEAPRSFITPIELGSQDGKELGFVNVQQRTGLLTVLDLAPAQQDNSMLKQVLPRRFATQVDAKNPPSYAVADLDGDGHLDIVLADPKGSQLRLLRQLSGGVFAEPSEFPCLAGVRAVAAADIDGDGRAEVFVASPTERVVAVSALTTAGRLTYPQALPTTGKPYGVVAADLDGDGLVEVAYSHEEKQSRAVSVLRRSAVDQPWQTVTYELQSISTTPRDLLVFDADQDGRLDLAVLAAHEPMQLLLQAADGSFTEATPDSGYRQGLVDGIERVALTLGDVDGDGHDELLVASEGYARSLRIGADGVLEVVDQYNTRKDDTKLAAAVVIDLESDGVPEIVLVEDGGEELQVLQRHEDGVYRYHESVPADGLSLVTGMAADLDGNGRQDLLLLGKRRFSWWPLGADDLEARVLATHETDLKDVEYHLIGVGDLNDDGSQEIVAIDSRGTHVLEVLSRSPSGSWHSAMHFTLFEADPHYEGQRGGPAEPRELVITDLTNDGRDDLALLIHDRVLLYPQVR